MPKIPSQRDHSSAAFYKFRGDRSGTSLARSAARSLAPSPEVATSSHRKIDPLRLYRAAKQKKEKPRRLAIHQVLGIPVTLSNCNVLSDQKFTIPVPPLFESLYIESTVERVTYRKLPKSHRVDHRFRERETKVAHSAFAWNRAVGYIADYIKTLGGDCLTSSNVETVLHNDHLSKSTIILLPRLLDEEFMKIRSSNVPTISFGEFLDFSEALRLTTVNISAQVVELDHRFDQALHIYDEVTSSRGDVQMRNGEVRSKRRKRGRRPNECGFSRELEDINEEEQYMNGP
ncbi:hypothetical protein CI109_106885 [Kwoniella shandongensis]|uniref:Uncharacterized protein n=1 Tax=Kwoniella shandongensis TaxID=1734106 RepID=A0A5M6CC53_9TREE|nr:uncharacterized protein CI109_000859 [Kwoniella shandongensis]KAA5530679.1 hypothetical protein CI109_000859 [Kwoniella shandongensis]